MSDVAPAPSRRNVVLCFDGTGDWIGSGKTNVAKLYAALDREAQVTFYDGGIGTLNDDRPLTSMGRDLRRFVDLGTASNLGQKVLNGYLFLVDRYRPGDRVFMFGFSRGAYTARLVASLIRDFGLLRSDARHLAPYLWQTANRRVEDSTESFKQREAYLDHELSFFDLREQFCIPTPQTPLVHFMGLFDTVSSVGVVSRFDVHRHIEENDWIRRVCHAVAMDEERNSFPELPFDAAQPGLTEVWFPGVHRDVGGGNPDHPTIANAALGWIAAEAAREGLILKTPIPVYDPAGGEPALVHRAGFDPYVFLGLYPMRIFVRRLKDFRTFWPNLRHVRSIPANALVHEVAKAVPLDRFTGRPPPHWPKEPVWYPENPAPPPDRSDAVARERASLGDLFGMALATPVLALVYLSAAGPVFGTVWPPGSKPFVVGSLLLVVVAQGLGRGVFGRLPPILRPRSPLVVALAAGFVFVYAWVRFPFPSWPVAYLAAFAGVALWAWAQLSPPAFLGTHLVRPPLRMERALGLLVQSLLAASLIPLLVAVGVVGLHLLSPEHGPLTARLWAGGVGFALLVGTTSGFIAVSIDREFLRRAEEGVEAPP